MLLIFCAGRIGKTKACVCVCVCVCARTHTHKSFKALNDANICIYKLMLSLYYQSSSSFCCNLIKPHSTSHKYNIFSISYITTLANHQDIYHLNKENLKFFLILINSKTLHLCYQTIHARIFLK